MAKCARWGCGEEGIAPVTIGDVVVLFTCGTDQAPAQAMFDRRRDSSVAQAGHEGWLLVLLGFPPMLGFGPMPREAAELAMRGG